MTTTKSDRQDELAQVITDTLMPLDPNAATRLVEAISDLIEAHLDEHVSRYNHERNREE